jgi:predicted enzyme related to lactoylglutathione lyase
VSAVVALELHTTDLPAASAFYEQLLGWRSERIETRAGSYLALGLGGDVDGGIVECGTARSLWLPYAEVDRISEATDRARGGGGAVLFRARRLGASVLLEPREGPAGWRSVVAAPAGGEIALWQQKDWR